jgi:hypothetical protein
MKEAPAPVHRSARRERFILDGKKQQKERPEVDVSWRGWRGWPGTGTPLRDARIVRRRAKRYIVHGSPLGRVYMEPLANRATSNVIVWHPASGYSGLLYLHVPGAVRLQVETGYRMCLDSDSELILSIKSGKTIDFSKVSRERQRGTCIVPLVGLGVLHGSATTSLMSFIAVSPIQRHRRQPQIAGIKTLPPIMM